jgi:hypothetical protein
VTLSFNPNALFSEDADGTRRILGGEGGLYQARVGVGATIEARCQILGDIATQNGLTLG